MSFNVYPGSSLSPISLANMYGAKPIWVSSSSFSINNYTCADSTETIVITNMTPTTLSTTTMGLNGILQSATLSGTVGTGGASLTTITGSGTSFSSVFQVGDVLWTASGATRITAIGSNTSLTVTPAITITNGTAFKRGGLAPDTYYYLYTISDDNSNGYILTTRNVSGGDVIADMPSIGLYKRQLRFFILTDVSSNIKQFVVMQGWPLQPFIQYAQGVIIFSGALPGSTWYTLNCSPGVPPVSVSAAFEILEETSLACYLTTPSFYPQIANVFDFGYASPPGSPGGIQNITLPIDQPSGNIMFYENVNPHGASVFSIVGVFVTEINN